MVCVQIFTQIFVNNISYTYRQENTYNNKCLYFKLNSMYNNKNTITQNFYQVLWGGPIIPGGG